MAGATPTRAPALPFLRTLHLADNQQDGAPLLVNTSSSAKPVARPALRVLILGDAPPYVEGVYSCEHNTTELRTAWHHAPHDFATTAMRHCAQLRVLSLCAVMPRASPSVGIMASLCASLAHGACPFLDALYLANNGLTQEDGECLVAAFADRAYGRRGLHVLELSYNRLQHVDRLLTCCGRFRVPVRYLGLGCNNVTEVRVPRAPHHLRGLEELVLECNECELSVAQYLYNRLLSGDLPALRVLDMEDNNICHEQQRALCEAFEERIDSASLHNGFTTVAQYAMFHPL